MDKKAVVTKIHDAMVAINNLFIPVGLTDEISVPLQKVNRGLMEAIEMINQPEEAAQEE